MLYYLSVLKCWFVCLVTFSYLTPEAIESDIIAHIFDNVSTTNTKGMAPRTIFIILLHLNKLF